MSRFTNYLCNTKTYASLLTYINYETTCSSIKQYGMVFCSYEGYVEDKTIFWNFLMSERIECVILKHFWVGIKHNDSQR